MNVFYGLKNLPVFTNAVITIGTFDGVHIGHLKVISRLLEVAKNVNGESLLITFNPHPRSIIHPESEIKLLTSLTEKITYLEATGLQHLVIVDFTDEFSNLSSEDYIANFLVKYFHPYTLIVGYDHHFGKNRTGDFSLLESLKKKYHYELEEIPVLTLQEINISSTQAREALRNGNLQLYKQYTNRNYFFTGNVIHGNKRGTQIGFPTANIVPSDIQKILPKQGVYVVRGNIHQQQYWGMMNIGTRPTIEDTLHLSIEVHFFQFNQNIYDEEIEIEIVERLRDEQKFDTLDALIAQLHLDKNKTLQRIEFYNTK